MNWQPPGFQPPGYQPPGWQPEEGGGAPSVATATVSGTSVSDLTETKVIAGNETTIIDLVNDTWATSGASFNVIRQDILDGITSAQSELFGWNNEVRDKENVDAVVRTSDSRVTITWSVAALYAIDISESITITVPASAVSSGVAIIATPALAVIEDEDRGIASSRGRKPRTRKVTIRSASHAMAGPELPYPVYHFSNRIFIERPGHNPFEGL